MQGGRVLIGSMGKDWLVLIQLVFPGIYMSGRQWVLLIGESRVMTEVSLLGPWSCPGQWGSQVRSHSFLVWRKVSWEE